MRVMRFLRAFMWVRTLQTSCRTMSHVTSTAALLPPMARVPAGTPKIVARVRKAKELLIKHIARETAALQQKLAVSGDAIIIDMSQGVPCLPIFEAAREAMVRLVDSRRLPYSDVAGKMSVRGAAARFVNKVYGLDPPFTASNTIITAGAVQAIFNCLSLSIEVRRGGSLPFLIVLLAHQTGASLARPGCLFLLTWRMLSLPPGAARARTTWCWRRSRPTASTSSRPGISGESL